jgi:hypothetical protein
MFLRYNQQLILLYEKTCISIQHPDSFGAKNTHTENRTLNLKTPINMIDNKYNNLKATIIICL